MSIVLFLEKFVNAFLKYWVAHSTYQKYWYQIAKRSEIRRLLNAVQLETSGPPLVKQECAKTAACGATLF
jgi:hypothetical protein